MTVNVVTASQPLSKEVWAEVKVDMTVMKAGPGSAYIDRGRLYRGDIVRILAKENLSDWVRVRAGKLEGFIQIKTLQFQRNRIQNNANSNVIRRHKDYEYDSDGRRVNLGGDWVGSGETNRSRRLTPSEQDASAQQQPRVSVGLGVGQLKRAFRSNSEVRSLLSSTSAGPVVFNSSVKIDYQFHPLFEASVSLLDYRLGQTTLQTVVLNEGNPFVIDNDGQILDVGMSLRWATLGWMIKGGPFLGWHRHAFQETQPMAVFLSASTVIIGGFLGASLDFGRASLGIETKYGKVLNSAQTPLKGGELNSGTQLSITAIAAVPLNQSLSIYLQAQLYQITVTYVGVSEHIDALTDPGQILSYTASEEENRLSSMNLGVTWQF